MAEGEPDSADVTRRTWLAAERTWLAWWRTGIGVGALGLAVGRLLPGVTHAARWPFIALGIAYAVLSVLIVLVGGVRQRRTASALRRGEFAQLASPLVTFLTAAAIVLALGAMALVVASS